VNLSKYYAHLLKIYNKIIKILCFYLILGQIDDAMHVPMRSPIPKHIIVHGSIVFEEKVRFLLFDKKKILIIITILLCLFFQKELYLVFIS
jgi:hypothetical protein